MSEVTLSIAGRTYAVSCADGEEAHVRGLGAVLHEKLQQLGGAASPQEAQNLLFAGLFVADELHETKQQLATALEAARAAGSFATPQAGDATIADSDRDVLMARIAELESLVDTLRAEQQQFKTDTDALRTEVNRHRQEAIEASEAKAAMADRVAGLSTEIDTMMAQVAALEDERNALVAKVDRLGSMSAVVAAGNGTKGSEDLAAALERFADLIEDCAEKLEDAERSA